MKRRNVDSSAGKLRRAAKRSKISDGYSYICNLKFLLVWALVITLDFIAEFRFELLYPFWVFINSVSETFKFKGISYLFSYIFVTLTIDMICYYVIPVHWLFFASSTYVWLQFSWYSDRGMNLLSVFIWIFFIGMEAFVRLRELKTLPIQFELCKPLAAHGIGYPIFTLGVGCKSYVHYRLRLHTKRVVAKENEFYYSLLQKALVPELTEANSTGPGGTPLHEYSHGSTSISTAPSTKYLASSASSTSTSSSLSLSSSSSGPDSAALAGQSAVASSKSHPISMHNSNGTASLSKTTASNTLRSTANTTNYDNSTADRQAGLPPVGAGGVSACVHRVRHFVRTLVASLSSLFMVELRLSSRLSKCLAGSFDSIHCVTSKVLATVTTTQQQPSSKTTSLTPSSQSSINSTANSQSSAGGEQVSANGILGSTRKRRGSLVEAQNRPPPEEMTVESQSHSRDHSTSSKSARQANGTTAKGAKSTELSETSLKKSNPSSKALDLSKSSPVSEYAHHPKSSCNGSLTSGSASSSSSESLYKKSNISNNSSNSSGTTITDGKVSSSGSTGKSSQEVILNGKVNGTEPAIELLNGTGPSKGSNKKNHKRGSLEDPRSLLDLIKTKEDQIWKVESDNQRLKAELQTIRQCESDLRQQLNCSLSVEKSLKSTISGHQSEIENLQKKVQLVQQVKQQDRANVQRLERLLEDEKRKAKTSSDMQVASEKKARMAEECAARASAIAEAVKNVCSESCRQRQREMEMDIAGMRKELHNREDHLRMKEMVLEENRDLKDKGNMLMAALSAMHDKNSNLEETLKLEKMLNRDLYSHMEELKQQISKQRVMSMSQDKTIRELKQKLSLYSASNAQNSFHVMTSTGVGLGTLNGFNTTGGTSTMNENAELVNRCFSSCSPNNTAASPSSLSSGTPPLASVGQSMLGSMRDRIADYSTLVDPVLSSPWPSSLKTSSSLSASSSSPSDIIGPVGGGISHSQAANCTSNGNNMSKAPGAPIGSGSAGNVVPLKHEPSSNCPTPNLSFNNRFDI